MPTYLYFDGKHHWDVQKPIRDLDKAESCPLCGEGGKRQLTLPNIDRSAASDWNTQTYHPALGCYTRSNRHARQLAKAKGYEEIGTEKTETVHRHFDEQRKETALRRWADADKGSDVAETLTTTQS